MRCYIGTFDEIAQQAANYLSCNEYLQDILKRCRIMYGYGKDISWIHDDSLCKYTSVQWDDNTYYKMWWLDVNNWDGQDSYLMYVERSSVSKEKEITERIDAVHAEITQIAQQIDGIRDFERIPEILKNKM